jgi:hypothetical protein
LVYGCSVVPPSCKMLWLSIRPFCFMMHAPAHITGSAMWRSQPVVLATWFRTKVLAPF